MNSKVISTCDQCCSTSAESLSGDDVINDRMLRFSMVLCLPWPFDRQCVAGGRRALTTRLDAASTTAHADDPRL